MTIRALRVNADFTTEELDLSTVDFFQKIQRHAAARSGIVQSFDVARDMKVWLDEEGKLMQLPINFLASAFWVSTYGMNDIIVGDVVFTGGYANGSSDGKLGPLTDFVFNQLQEDAATLKRALEGGFTITPM